MPRASLPGYIPRSMTARFPGDLPLTAFSRLCRQARFPAVLALAALLLSGCVLPAGGPAADYHRRPVTPGKVVVAAPSGYCIEPASVVERADTALVLLGRCAGAETRGPAVLTASVGAAGSASGLDIVSGGQELAAFFRSERGRAALSRRGRAGDVTLHQAVGIPGAFLLRFDDKGAKAAAMQPESWRAILTLRGRLVSLSVSGIAGQPGLGRTESRALLEAFVTAVRRANPGAAVTQ